MRFIRESIAKRSTAQTESEALEDVQKKVPADAAQAAMDAINVKSVAEVEELAPQSESAMPEPVAELAEGLSERQEDQIEAAPEPSAKAVENDTQEVEAEAEAVEAEAEAVEVEAVEVAPVMDAPAEVNIWDMGEDDVAETVPAPAPTPTPVPMTKAEEISAPPRTRRPVRRNKTRILGFEPQDTTVNALFEEDLAVVAKNVMSMNPTGWLIVVAGPGRGASFPLFTGMSQIGRSDDQTISLDFGDTSISRANHASIAYDPVEHKFYFGHGGKSNLVRLNGKPVLSTEVTKDGDEFMIGETTLRLRTLCGPDFNWETSGSEGDGHVAIA